MAFNKLVAVFLVCLVFGAALNADKAAAEDFKVCFENCLGECLKEHQGYTICEMKCDARCDENELVEKLKSKFH